MRQLKNIGGLASALTPDQYQRHQRD